MNDPAQQLLERLRRTGMTQDLLGTRQSLQNAIQRAQERAQAARTPKRQAKEAAKLRRLQERLEDLEGRLGMKKGGKR